MTPHDQEYIGVDLDGTLAVYRPGMGPTEIGEPLEPMVARVKAWLTDGTEVRIITARAAPDAWDGDIDKAAAAICAIMEWTKLHVGRALWVQCYKCQRMRELWDDRARRVEYNTGRAL